MTLHDFFRPTPVLSATEARSFLWEHGPEGCTLLDVREPQEYLDGHLPGAQLIPLAELKERCGELDPARPVLAYCARGLRSRAAGLTLFRAGFAEVYSLAGGVRALEETLATGDPAPQLARFRPGRSPEEQVALAWLLEEGTCRFYAALAGRCEEQPLAATLETLAGEEEGHERLLTAVYEGLTGMPAQAGFAREVLGEKGGAELIEGGAELETALEWCTGKSPAAILDLAMAIEVNAWDRYLLLAATLADPNARRVFELISDEERRHLQRLASIARRPSS